jgi:hypothetical protein
MSGNVIFVRKLDIIRFPIVSLEKNKVMYCYVYQCLKTVFGLIIGFIDHLQVVTTINCNFVTDFHTKKHSTLISSVYLH